MIFLEWNPTFFIGDPMNKVHMGKNKSLVSSANTKIDLRLILSFHAVCESVGYCIIRRLNFVVKILWGIRVLTLKQKI